MSKITIDFETRSCVDLKNCGLGVYSTDRTTDILCLAVKVDDEPARVWTLPGITPSEPCPEIALGEIFYLIQDVDGVEAHNCGFEAAIWEGVGVKKYGWPELPVEKLRCSMAKAAYHNLPKGLGDLALALGVDERKDKDGLRTMLKMCRPRRILKAEAVALEDELDMPWNIIKSRQEEYYDVLACGYQPYPRSFQKLLLWHENPSDVTTLLRYCLQDVETEYAISQELPELPDSEHAIWTLDQKVNKRGLGTDVAMSKRMITMVDRYQDKLLKECERLTGGAVRSPKQVAALKKCVSELLPDGLELEDLSASSVRVALKDPRITGTARRLLEIRKAVGMSSTSKYKAIIDRSSSDKRLRHTLVYHGASTGRWVSKGVQLQNLPRGNVKDVDTVLALSDFDMIESLWDDPMSVASACIRSMFVAEKGREFTCADFANIEGRITAWLAGEEWKVQAFEDFDAGKGADLYKLAYSKGFGVDVGAVTSDQRQIGKIMELSCFGADTEVLTDRGWARIVEVSTDDLVWDGEEFVAHSGVVGRGVRPCISLFGVEVTPDHHVFIGEEECVSAEDLLQNTSALKLATSLGIGSFAKLSRSRQAGCTPLCAGARAERSEHRTYTPCVAAEVPAATCAQNVSQQWQTPCTGLPKNTCVKGCSGASPMRYDAAQTPRVELSTATAVGGSRFIQNGSQTGPLFCSTCSHSPDVRTQHSLSTGSTTIRGTCQETSDLLGQESSDTTNNVPGGSHTTGFVCQEQSFGNCTARDTHACPQCLRKLEPECPPKTSSMGKEVFDLINAGPRHRFTIRTNAGPLIVHNCGFGGGSGAFAKMAGMYGLSLPEDAAKENVSAWRAAHPNVVKLWRSLEEAAFAAVRNPEKAFRYRCVTYKMSLCGRFLQAQLPSGRCLHYPFPRFGAATMPWGESKTVLEYKSFERGTEFTNKLYGGLLTENVVQAIARDTMAEAMLRLEKAGHRVVLTVHDEVLTEHVEGFGSVTEFCEIMAKVPSWAPGLPVAAAGWRGNRYKK